jgi:hypothetical protein
MSARSLALILSGLSLCVAAALCAGEPPPAKSADAGTVPEQHGIAVSGMRSHHVDLAMLILDGESGPSKSAKLLHAELKLRAEQFPKLLESMGKAFESAPDGGDAKAAEKAMDIMEERILAQFRKTLTAEQQARFEQLSCQLAGPMALRLNNYASRLELSNDQLDAIRDLVDAYCDKAAPHHRAGFVTRSENAERKLCALAQELDNKILGLLTEKQRAKWATFLGKRFDWTALTKT